MNIAIVELNAENLHDLPLRDQPYRVIGKMNLRYDGEWSYTESLLERPYTKRFPQEDGQEQYLSEGKTAFLAYADGIFAGDVRLRRDWNLYAFIDHIGVEPGLRGMGVGAALLRAAEGWARAQSMKGLALESQDVNLLAARFYTKNGFSIGGVNTRFYSNFGSDEIAVFWYKPLPA